MKEIRITCKGAAMIGIGTLENFQGELKKLSEKEYRRLFRASAVKRLKYPNGYLCIVAPIQGRLFRDGNEVKHLALVSNREDLSPADLLRWHWRKSGTIEHVHEVIKNELGAGIVPSQRFGANAAWFRLNLLTYNCLSLLKRHALPERLRDAKPKRLRYEIFSMAASIREHARELTARLGVPPLTVDELVCARQKLLELAAQWKKTPDASPPELPLS